MAFLEGKELEYKIGEYGAASVDVKPDLTVEVAVGIQLDIVKEVKKLAQKTSTPIDDAFVATLEKIILAAKTLGV